ncbi:MAG: proline racemase family protein [Acidobacteria bacterium]|nr:proline racemase family protein [Acidobacteriota bacterium]
MTFHTLDAHTGGEPLRLILDGWPEPDGDTILEKRAFAKSKQDHLRRVLMHEPRGHADMYGALLTKPERPDSDVGVLFMHNEGFSLMCGHGVIAVTKMVVERGLRPGISRSLVLDAPAGQIRATAHVRETRDGSVKVDRVSFINVPSFVLAAGVPVTVGSRTMHVDVAFGGAFYAIVDAESAGLAVVPGKLTELRAMGDAISRAVEKELTVVHPLEPGLNGIYGTIFTGPPTVPGADLRNVTIFADKEVDRSPCGTGTCAVLAVLDAMGLVDPERPFVHESIVGSTFSARVTERAMMGDIPTIIPELSGSASITGEHTFIVENDDLFKKGFRL